MTFAEAYCEMRNGKCIAHEEFDGDYWTWENNTVMFNSDTGLRYPIQGAPDIGRVFDRIVEDKWNVVYPEFE